MKFKGLRTIFGMIAVMLVVIQFAIPTAYSANEFTKRTDVPSIDNYTIEIKDFDRKETPESVKTTKSQVEEELASQKQARAFSYKTINSLIQIAKKTTTDSACKSISSSYICNVSTDSEELSTFTFEYKTKYKDANFKVITTVNANGDLESQSRYTYGEHKYDIFYDSETNSISKVIFYVDNLNTLEWDLEEDGTIFHSIYRFYYANGQLQSYIETGVDSVLLEEIYYYESGQVSENYVYDNGYSVYDKAYYENGQLHVYIEYNTIYDDEGYGSSFVTEYTIYNQNGTYSEIYKADPEYGTAISLVSYNEQGKKYVAYAFHPYLDVIAKATQYYTNGKIKSVEEFDTESLPISSSQYSIAGKIQNSYTYFSTRNVNTEKLYDVNGKLAQYSVFYTTGKYKTLSNYNAGKISNKTDYISTGRARYTSYHTNGKTKTVNTYKNGKTTGSTTYNTSGRIVQNVTYKNGLKTYVYKYNTSGKLTTKYQYNSKEVLSQKWTYNSKTNKVSTHSTYHSNGKVKVLKKYDSKGKLQSKTVYNSSGKQTSHVTY